MSATREVLKCILAIALIFTFLFSIYLYIIGEWIAGSFWIAATMSASFAVCAEDAVMVMGALTFYGVFMLAAFISHIIFLATINQHVAFSYPDQSLAVNDLGFSQIRQIFISSNILGIVFSVLASIFVIPTMLFLAGAMKHHDKKMARRYQDTQDPHGLQQTTPAQQQTTRC